MLAGGANQPSLIEAQRNFEAFGACELAALAHCRPPSADDARDPTWRAIDPTTDTFPSWPPDGDVRQDGGTALYYWRRAN
jgi:cysteine-rich CPCC protein